MTLLRVTLACAVVWACSCGIQGRVPLWVQMLAPANAAVPVEKIELVGKPPVIVQQIAGQLYLCGVWGQPRTGLILKCALMPTKSTKSTRPKAAALPA